MFFNANLGTGHEEFYWMPSIFEFSWFRFYCTGSATRQSKSRIGIAFGLNEIRMKMSIPRGVPFWIYLATNLQKLKTGGILLWWRFSFFLKSGSSSKFSLHTWAQCGKKKLSAKKKQKHVLYFLIYLFSLYLYIYQVILCSN